MNNSLYINEIKSEAGLTEPFETVAEYKIPSGTEYLIKKNDSYYILASSLRGFTALAAKIPFAYKGKITIPSFFGNTALTGRKAEVISSTEKTAVLSVEPLFPVRYDHNIIDSKKDPVFAEIKRAEALSHRKEDGLIVLEEERLVKRAVDDRLDVLYILYSPKAQTVTNGTLEKAKALGIPCFIINDGLMASITETKPVPKELALVRLPSYSISELSATGNATVLIADNVENPDNLGLIIRTADACGADAVISVGTEASIFHRNCIRASRGAMGRFPVFEYDVSSFKDMIKELREQGYTIFGSSARTNLTVHDTGDTSLRAFVVSNETNGITDRMRAECDEMIRIPMASGQSSFNVAVAAGIILAFALKFE